MARSGRRRKDLRPETERQNIIPRLSDEIALTCLAKISHGYHGVLECVSKKWRDAIRSPYYANLKGSQGWSGNWLFVVSYVKGSVYLDAYDPDANRWHPLPSMPPIAMSVNFFRQFSCVVACKKLLIIGGCYHFNKQRNVTRSTHATLSNQVMSFNPYTKQWSRGACMKTGRFSHACATIGGNVYVAGGYMPETKQTLASAEVYDPILDRWEDLPEMPFSLRFGTGLAIGGEFHVIGVDEHLVYLIYDPVGCKWRREEDVSYIRHHDVHIDNTIEIDNEVFHFKDGSVNVLVKETKKWKQIGALPPMGERDKNRVYGLCAFREILYVIIGPIIYGYPSGDTTTYLSVWFCNTRKLPLEWQDARGFHCRRIWTMVAGLEE